MRSPARWPLLPFGLEPGRRGQGAAGAGSVFALYGGEGIIFENQAPLGGEAGIDLARAGGIGPVLRVLGGQKVSQWLTLPPNSEAMGGADG